MSESKDHRNYIKYLHAKAKDIVPPECKKLILIDSDQCTGSEIPSFTEEGFRPDLYYCFRDLLIIGEAKTPNDILTNHSKKQYKSYIRKCSEFKGTSYILLATSWLASPALSDHFRVIVKSVNPSPKVLVLDELKMMK